MKRMVGCAGVCLYLITTAVWSQGQDSTEYARDLQVISTMLPGRYDNMNQFYFDRRGDKTPKHKRVHSRVHRLSEAGPNVFAFVNQVGSGAEMRTSIHLAQLTPDDETRTVKMRSWPSDATDLEAIDAGSMTGPSCDVYWVREAAQFRASGSGCEALDLPNKYVLSEPELWMAYPAREAGDFELHRAREMECYADIPGVGGGRDEPYERYDGLHLHDQGGMVWFDTVDDRRMGISVFLVDWPINNYEGIFTRNSLVIYVSEELETGRKEHGYAFTVPEADRIGINLKWMLAACFMESNQFATPEM